MEKEVDIENLWSQVEEYIAEFVDSSTGRLPYAMQLKHEHTLRVLDNISIISRGEGFNSRLVSIYLKSLLFSMTSGDTIN